MLSGLAWQSITPLPAATEPDAPAPQPTAVPASSPECARLLAALRSKIPIAPPELKNGDPYLTGRGGELPPIPAESVCGVRFEKDQVHYRLATFANQEAARTAGFAVTHFGVCGTCSTLQDLSVYIERPDLTTPVRRCGIDWGSSTRLMCLEELGLSSACAQTWLYNIDNTRHQCFGVCVWSWITGEAPAHRDGRLNACLQCDEDRSGPIFKATAGRTRRNSGLQSSIPRPADEVAPVVHDYVPDAPAKQ
ncbi:MAG: hypothetical protein JO203_08675 [Gammaproteobacteria bacterium]|nr:hypothetical protein [Gammaproteobacteria bacterium]